jgi:phospholipid/cholesterol/gamma-HCH transport system ATP-binding protein
MTKIIEVKNLVTTIKEKVIHKNLNLHINKGEIYAIVGGSGSGKTVLLREMIMLMKPTSGSINILGIDVTKDESFNLSLLSKKIGVLFQSGALISSLTVIQNVALPLKENTRLPVSVINDLCVIKLSLANFPMDSIHLYPSELSGGMVKRASLARALIMDPEILFLDEPTSGLDPVSSSLFNNTIRELRDLLGITIVIVTHDLLTINSIVDRMLVILNGEKLAEGTPKEISRMEHPWIKEYFQLGGV